MSGMAEVLKTHTRRGGIRKGAIHCECGWSQSIISMTSSKGAFAAHQAAMLTAAGFGPVREAKAEAWDEGHNHCFHVEDPRNPDRNPYRGPKRSRDEARGVMFPDDDEDEQHIPDAHAATAEALRVKFLRPAGTCVVMSGEPFADGCMAGYINANRTRYDIIATGTEEEMIEVARRQNGRL